MVLFKGCFPDIPIHPLAQLPYTHRRNYAEGLNVISVQMIYFSVCFVLLMVATTYSDWVPMRNLPPQMPRPEEM